MLWQLLEQLNSDEVLIQLPEWLAEEKVGYVEGARPMMFIGRIEQETEKAIQVDDSADAGSLMKVKHRMDHLEQGEDGAERNDWLDDRLADHRQSFEKREDVVTLQEKWLPKLKIHNAVRRVGRDG